MLACLALARDHERAAHENPLPPFDASIALQEQNGLVALFTFGLTKRTKDRGQKTKDDEWLPLGSLCLLSFVLCPRMSFALENERNSKSHSELAA